MSQEKTEKATPRRREKAREEGQVAKSNDLNSALTLFTGMLLLNFMMGNALAKLQLILKTTLNFQFGLQITTQTIVPLLTNYIIQVFYLIAPFLGGAALIGALASFLQVGLYFNPKLLKPKFSKLNPLKGLKNLFSLRSVIELLKALFKIGVITLVAYLVVRGQLDSFYTYPFISLNEAIASIGQLIFTLGLTISISLLALGIADYIYQKYEFEKSIKMSKQEVKQEWKDIEGDPQIINKRKQRMRQMAMNRMIQAVPQADVIITNPTHIAVAIQYDIEEMEAPLVLAIGEDNIAQKIRQLAEEHRIEIVENKPLARALYETAEVGQTIPVELYQAVAEVLAFVYRLQKRKI